MSEDPFEKDRRKQDEINRTLQGNPEIQAFEGQRKIQAFEGQRKIQAFEGHHKTQAFHGNPAVTEALGKLQEDIKRLGVTVGRPVGESAEDQEAADKRLAWQREQTQQLMDAVNEPQRVALEAAAQAQAEQEQRELTTIEVARANLAAVEKMRDVALSSAEAAAAREKRSAEREARMVAMTKTLLNITWVLAAIAFVALVVTIVGS